MANKFLRRLVVMQVLAFQAHSSKHANTVAFDTDSGPVGIDNRASGCMSGNVDDFIGTLQPVSRTIKGFGGSRVYNVSICTLKWPGGCRKSDSRIVSVLILLSMI